MELSYRRVIIYTLIFLLGIIIFSVMDAVEDKFVLWAKKNVDIITSIELFIIWNTIKLFFLGLAIGVVSIPFSYIVNRLLFYELTLEKVFGRRIYSLDLSPRVTIWNLVKHGYILFAPIIILTKIFSTILSADILTLYLLIGETIKGNMWVIYLVLTLPYIILDYSRIRSFNNKSIELEPPSRFMNLVALILLGAGSIASAVPIFYDIVGIFKDIQLSIILFAYAIALFYLPALFFVLATYLVFFNIGKEDYDKVLDYINNRVADSFGVLKIGEEKKNLRKDALEKAVAY